MEIYGESRLMIPWFARMGFFGGTGIFLGLVLDIYDKL